MSKPERSTRRRQGLRPQGWQGTQCMERMTMRERINSRMDLEDNDESILDGGQMSVTLNLTRKKVGFRPWSSQCPTLGRGHVFMSLVRPHGHLDPSTAIRFQTRYITVREGLSSDTEAASQLGQEDVES